jgi:N-acetylglucosamine-6-phosphate deacetylase
MTMLITGGPLYCPERMHDPGAVLVDGAVIRAVGPSGSLDIPPGTETVDVDGRSIIPGLIDLHLHGFGGSDVMGPDLAQVIEALPASGTTGFLPTTVSAPIDSLVEALRAMAKVLEAPPVGARVLGIHLEGPWVSPLRSGGMRAEFCRPLSRADVRRCQTAARGAVRMITLAPEEHEALALIAWLVNQGIIASVGHSDADYDTVSRAVTAGLNHATHTFNAMRPLHHRDPGTVGAVLDHDAIVAELIADGYHVGPVVMRLLIHAKGTRRVCLVSDAMFVTGMPPGDYNWDGRTLVRAGETSRFLDGALAGSAMTLNQMLRVVVQKVGLPFADALRMASDVPAQVLGLRKGRLAPGYDADVVVLNDDYRPSLTLVGGRVVHREGTVTATQWAERHETDEDSRDTPGEEMPGE